MATLSDDMIAEIILKLPVKSVARSKCVAKNWCAAISDDYIRRRLPMQVSVVYFPDDPDDDASDAARGGRQGPRFARAVDGGSGVLEDCDLDFFPFREGGSDVVACDACNGLVLLRSTGTARLYYVVDPVTRRWAALPPRPSSDDAALSVLAFDPCTTSPRYYYYVLNFTRWRDGGAEIEVFSSEAWAWAAPRHAEFGYDDLLCGSVHFHDGAVYLLAADTDRAVRVDVVAEQLACTAVQLPEPVDGDGRVAHSGGRLHYVTSDRDTHTLKVWVLDDEGRWSTWRLKHAVTVRDVAGEQGCWGGGGGEVSFLALHPEKDAVYVWSLGKLVEYDLVRKEVTGSWKFSGGGGDKDRKGNKNRVVKTWLVPSSLYLSDHLTDRHVQF